MKPPQTDDPNEIALYKARRKEVQARYYRRHRRMIKFAWSLNVSMKTARAIARLEQRA